MNDVTRELTQRDWRTLVRTIEHGTCILLLGPDVAVDPDDPERGPLTEALARDLARELAGIEPVVDETNLSHVTQLYYHRYRNRVGLELAVDELYAPYDEMTTDFHRDLASLPFALCINTTPDRFLYNALCAAGKSPLLDYYHFRKARRPSLTGIRPECPVVYDLYGNREDGASLVLTENDILEFLVNVVKGTPPLPAFLTSRFADPHTSFLFLGFGFHHWYIRILLHVLQAHGHRQRSLALEGASFFAHPDQSRTAVFFATEHFIDFKELSWAGFATALRRQYEKEARRPPASAPQLPPDAPTAFLCHCSADREEVAALEERLNGLAVNTWRDRQSLRGGDDWERLIPHVIRKQVDYVVVLETPRMLERVESYFHREINVALDRQQEFAEDFRFVLPAFLAPCEGLEKLAHLHAIDVTTEDGIDALAKAIHEDWKRRRARQSAAEGG